MMANTTDSPYVYGALYGPHDPPLPLSTHHMRALDHAARRVPGFDAYRCGAHHMILTMPDVWKTADEPRCEECVGESLPPMLIAKYRPISTNSPQPDATENGGVSTTYVE